MYYEVGIMKRNLSHEESDQNPWILLKTTLHNKLPLPVFETLDLVLF